MAKKPLLSQLMKDYVDEAVKCDYGVVAPGAIVHKVEADGLDSACKCYQAGYALYLALVAAGLSDKEIGVKWAGLDRLCEETKTALACPTCGCTKKGRY